MTKRTTKEQPKAQARAHNTNPSDWRPVFLAKLSETGLIGESCKAADVSKNTVYVHRRDDPEFAKQWDEAKRVAFYGLEDEAIRRARDGFEKPIYYQGELVGTEQQYSDTLLIFLMKAGSPEIYRDRLDITSDGKALAPAFNSFIAAAKAAGAETPQEIAAYLDAMAAELRGAKSG